MIGLKLKLKKYLIDRCSKNHAVGIGGLKYLRVNRVSIESDPIGFLVFPLVFDPIGFHWFLVLGKDRYKLTLLTVKEGLV